MRKININNIINKLLIAFFIIQPLFDMKFFYNSISTLIRVIIIFILFSYYLFSSKNKRKYYLLIYPCLICMYFIFHHINASSFTSLVPGNFNYSVLKEALYFVKMLSPFLLIFCLYESKLSSDDIIRIMKSLCIIISLVIIISNLFGFSYGNYSDVRIKANFFEWFNPNSSYTYQDLASKGLFEFGNQIGAILIMILPFMIYLSLKKHTLINWITIAFNIFALILLCTRVSVLGILVVLIYTLFAFGFVSLIYKKNIQFRVFIPIGIVLLSYSILLPFNPMFNRLNERANIIQTFSENTINATTNEVINSNIVAEDKSTNNINLDNIAETSKDYTNSLISTDITYNDMIDFIENTYETKQLNKQFLFENYPYKYDPEFWYNFLQKDISLTTDYRYIETAMIKRVVEINNNPLDKWVGITNTRLQNVFNIERDLVVQYYSLGIIGTILIFAPYLMILGCFIYKTFKNKFKNINFVNIISFITILFLFVISYMSGNLLNSLSFTIYFTLVFGLLINNN